MNQSPLPSFDLLVERWRAEHLRRLAMPVFAVLSGVLLILLTAMLGFSLAAPVLWGVAFAVAALWLTVAGIFVWSNRRRPALSALAKRADVALQLPDDLLSLIESPTGAEEWRKASWQKIQDQFAKIDLRQAWPIHWSRLTGGAGVLAGLLTMAVIGVGWNQLQIESQRLTAERAVQAERLAIADAILEDWKEFSKTTDDPELKALFAEAEKLQSALQKTDPLAAMAEMNRLQQKMSSLEATLASESIASHSTQLAEALAAFEGMGAMSSALRNQNFEAAAKEAEKWATELQRDPQGQQTLRQGAAGAELLARESAVAGKRGNLKLSKTLDEMAQIARSAKGSVPKSQLVDPAESLRDQFSQENARKNQGRTAQTGQQQLNSLRRRLQGENAEDSPYAQLSQSAGQAKGGPSHANQEAGTTSGEPPQGELVNLPDAGTQESVTGQLGKGESETRTVSAATGSGTVAVRTKTMALADYVELSRQAISDENLPLAHRRVIRTYFERIRSTADPQTP